MRFLQRKFGYFRSFIFLFLGLIGLIFTTDIQPGVTAPTYQQINVDPVSGSAGSTVTVSGQDFTPGDGILLWDGAQQRTLTIDGNGQFSVSYTIPGDASPSFHLIEVCWSTTGDNCAGGEFQERASFQFEVTEPPTPIPPTDTPVPPTATPVPPTPVPPTFAPPTTIPPTLPPITREDDDNSAVCENLATHEEATVYGFERHYWLGRFGIWFDRSTYDFGGYNPDVAPHSGEKVGASVFGEFGSSGQPLMMTFTPHLQAVGMYVGMEEPTETTTDVTVQLDVYGYEAGSTELTRLGGALEILPPEATDVTRCIAFEAEEGDLISRAVVEYVDMEGHSIYERRLIDDLIAIPASPDEIPEGLGNNITVEITEPADGTVFTTEEFFFVRGQFQVDLGYRDVDLFLRNYHRIGGTPSVSPEDPQTYNFNVRVPISDLDPGASNPLKVHVSGIGVSGEDRITVRYDPPPTPTPVPDLDISAVNVEVTQSVQCMGGFASDACRRNVIPVHTGKPTMVRLYLRADGIGDTPPTVGGSLCLTDTSDCVASNNVVTVTGVEDPVAEHRQDLSKTLNFMVPPEWVSEPGQLSFTARVNTGLFTISENDYENNAYPYRMPIVPSRRLDIVMVRVGWEGPSGTIFPALGSRAEAVDYLRQVFPTNTVRVWVPVHEGIETVDYDFTPTPDSGCGKGWSKLLNYMDRLDFFTDDPVGNLFWYGMIDNDVPVGYVGCGEMGGDSSGGVTDTGGNKAGAIMAQEIGHNMGRKHAPGCDANNTDNNFPVAPDSRGRLVGALPSNALGIDLRDNTLYPGMSSYDIMGYCGGWSQVWVSPYTYQDMVDDMPNVTAGLPESSAPALAYHGDSPGLITAQDNTEYLVGSLEIDGGSVSLNRRFFRTTLPGEEIPSGEEGPYIVSLYDTAGEVLVQRRFSVPDVHGTHEGIPREGIISAVIPWDPSVASIDVRRDGSDSLLTIPVSPNPPEVQLLSPTGGEVWPDSGPVNISWQASDPDGDTLQYLLQYSTDGGETWSLLAMDIQETTYTLDTGRLAGSDAARVRVLVSDGVRTSSSSSDEDFIVEQKPPHVSIASPADGETFYLGTQVVLSGSAIDLEDGALESSTYQWHSSLDGDLGSGDSLWAIPLSEGTHTITLSITDSDGNTATDTVEITVANAPRPLPETAADEESQAEESQPDTDVSQDGNGLSVIVIGAFVLALLVLLGGGFYWLGRVSKRR